MGPRRPLGCDRAVSDTLGVVLMVAVTFAMAAGLYVWVFGAGLPAGEPPAALSLAPAKASGERVRAWTVAGVSQEMAWSDLSLRLDGKELKYDGKLVGGGKFCVATETADCLPTERWTDALVPLQAGHTLRIHDTDLAGKTLEVVDKASGTLVLRVPLGGAPRIG